MARQTLTHGLTCPGTLLQSGASIPLHRYVAQAMPIKQIELHCLQVPRAYTTRIAQEGGGARSEVQASPFLLIEATTESGQIGWGEISDVPPNEMPDLGRLRESVASLLIGHDPFHLQALHQRVGRQYPPSPTHEFPRLLAAGLDMVCYDLAAQTAGIPIYQLLGGPRQTEVRISWVAFIRDDLQQLQAEIAEKKAAGFDAFKLKVGVDIELDEARLAILRETAGPSASIKIDPNGGWSYAEAARHIPRLARYGLDGVETPIAFRDPQELAALRRQVDVPLIEHVFNSDDALRYIRHDALDCFNIATTGCGGIWPARIIAEMAQTAGIGILLGSTVELGLGTLAQLHLAASIGDLTLPSDLVGPALYTDDVLASPLVYRKGRLDIPQRPGLGGTVQRGKLQALARSNRA